MNRQAEPRDPASFTTLDSFLEGQGVRDDAQTLAVREVLAWQVTEAMRETGLSRAAVARRMNTSPVQVRRLLNPKDGGVALTTLQKAAEMVGRKVRLDLI